MTDQNENVSNRAQDAWNHFRDVFANHIRTCDAHLDVLGRRLDEQAPPDWREIHEQAVDLRRASVEIADLAVSSTAKSRGASGRSNRREHHPFFFRSWLMTVAEDDVRSGCDPRFGRP